MLSLNKFKVIFMYSARPVIFIVSGCLRNRYQTPRWELTLYKFDSQHLILLPLCDCVVVDVSH